MATTARLIDTKEVAGMLKCCAKHVNDLDKEGRIPRPTKLGRLVRYSAGEISKWIDAGCPPRTEWEAMKSASAN